MSDFDRWGGSWTESKINTLRSYLQSFQTALKHTAFHRTYFDALAGDGTWRERDRFSVSLPGLDISERETVETIREGSALAAIGVEPPFDRYVFNDLDHDKAAYLKDRAIEKGRNIEAIDIRALDANEFVREFCLTLNSKTQRGVVLLDPWGMQVNWSTVECIARTLCLDMWYLFPTQAILRMLPHARPPAQAWSDRLDVSLGSQEWRTEFYLLKTDDGDLFNDPQNRLQRKASFAAVEAFVVRRLKETFLGSVLDEPLRLGPRNRPIFSFCFASANPSPKAKSLTERLAKGVVKANRA